MKQLFYPTPFMSKEQKIFFIVGNSRSGTTLMMRILGKHSQIRSINELHFFNSWWNPDRDEIFSQSKARKMLTKMFTVQHDGFFSKVDFNKYQDQINEILENAKNLSSINLYSDFLYYETKKAGKTIACEKTPQYVFYLEEILTHFPNAHIINMIRDPRAVLLSQKRKWKRKFLGGDFMTYKEILRLFINYHPLTISRLWNSSIIAGQKFAKHPNVLNFHFENLLESSQTNIKNLCDFLNIDFETEMLQVPQSGSSSRQDEKDKTGIRKTRARSWEKELSKTEIYLCEKVSGKLMKKNQYELVNPRPGFLGLLYYFLIFPVKIALSFLININRMKSIIDTLKRRMVK
jgi:hypothetical protein